MLCWKVHNMHFDFIRALTIAQQLVWPQACVRLCQFHAIQAILHWETDQERDTNDRDKSRPQLSISDKRAILIAFRYLQRCQTMADWPVARRRFKDSLMEILEVNDETQEGPNRAFSKLWKYFEENWFNEFWLGMLFLHYIFAYLSHSDNLC